MPSDVVAVSVAFAAAILTVIGLRAWRIRHGHDAVPWPRLLFALVAGSALFGLLWIFVLRE